MRSGHSLAFQQFEEVLSEVQISRIDASDQEINDLIQSSSLSEGSEVSAPFRMTWAAESDWEPDDPNEVSSGSCLIVPMPIDDSKGILRRSVGYAEAAAAESSYSFLSD